MMTLLQALPRLGIFLPKIAIRVVACVTKKPVYITAFY
jgi:hypothetical protein